MDSPILIILNMNILHQMQIMDDAFERNIETDELVMDHLISIHFCSLESSTSWKME